MKSEIFVPSTEIVTPETLAAEPKNTGQSAWVSHASMVLGAFGVAGLVRSASAQNDALPPMTAAPGTDPSMSGNMPMSGQPMMNGNMPMNGMSKMSGGGMPMVPAPTDNQAVVGNSAVPSSSNPNNPATTIPASGKSATPSDIDILNFALGLEYLEAEYYARIVAAHQARPYLTDRAFMAAQKLAMDEAAHVTSITDILTRAGATPVAKPAFKFPDSVFYSQVAFLTTATAMEETGVGAYSDSAPKVQSNAVLKFAASVYGVECRHTALIRNLNGLSFAPTEFEVPLTMAQVQQRVAPFMAT